MSIDAVMARMADIQSRIDSLSGRSQMLATTTVSGNSTDFAQALAAATGDQATATNGQSATPLVAEAAQIGSPVGGAKTGADLVAAAKKYLGVPYVWGGTSAKGLDCSGLVLRSLRDIGKADGVPRTAREQAKLGKVIPSLDQAKPGDLIGLGRGTHIGIYVGNGMMIHAPKRGDVVRISKVYAKPDTIRRILPEQPAVAASSANFRAVLSNTTPSGAVGAATRADLPAGVNSRVAQYADLLSAATTRNRLPKGLLAAVMMQESGGRADVVSSAGAVGLMQFMPGTAASLGINPRDPAQAIDGAGRLLRSNLDRFGSVQLALAAYNAGPGAVSKYHGIPPYAETRNYVKNIMAMIGG